MLEKSLAFCYTYNNKKRYDKGVFKMPYKKGTRTVISVPITVEHNTKLYELANAKKSKSKTSLAKEYLEKVIEDEYEKMEK
jgi:hypothetical protein